MLRVQVCTTVLSAKVKDVKYLELSVAFRSFLYSCTTGENGTTHLQCTVRRLD